VLAVNGGYLTGVKFGLGVSAVSHTEEHGGSQMRTPNLTVPLSEGRWYGRSMG
jgi:hypothetical protein